MRTKTGAAADGPGTAVITATSGPTARRLAGFAEQFISRYFFHIYLFLSIEKIMQYA